MPTARTPQLGSLDSIARSVRRAQEAVAYGGSLADYKPDQGRDFAIAAKEHCTAALTTLETIGAQIPGIETDAPTAATSVPLHLLDR